MENNTLDLSALVQDKLDPRIDDFEEEVHFGFRKMLGFFLSSHLTPVFCPYSEDRSHLAGCALVFTGSAIINGACHERIQIIAFIALRLTWRDEN